MKRFAIVSALTNVADVTVILVFAATLAAAPLEGQILPSPVANPEAVTAGVPTLVKLTLALTDPSIKRPKLQFWDTAKGKWKPVAALRDDGKFGDSTAGDSTFSRDVQLFASSGSVQLGLPGGKTLRIKGVVPTPLQLRVIAKKKGQRGLIVSSSTSMRVLNVSVPQGVVAAGGTVGDPTVVASSPGATLVDVSVSAAGSAPLSGFLVLVSANPQQLSLSDWFSQNVDEGGVIAAAGSYGGRTFSDGRQALVAVAPLPADYEGPALAYAFVMSPAGKTVAAVALSADSNLPGLGYSTPDSQHALLDTFIETLTVDD